MHILALLSDTVITNAQLNKSSFLLLDVGSWREGGGRNLNTAPGPPEMENRASEEGATDHDNSTPPAEVDEPGRNVTTDSQREKRDGRERLAPSTPPQPKLNGGQQPPGGVPAHFDPAFRSMMPSYVSSSVAMWTKLRLSQLQ